MTRNQVAFETQKGCCIHISIMDTQMQMGIGYSPTPPLQRHKVCSQLSRCADVVCIYNMPMHQQTYDTWALVRGELPRTTGGPAQPLPTSSSCSLVSACSARSCTGVYGYKFGAQALCARLYPLDSGYHTTRSSAMDPISQRVGTCADLCVVP